MKESILVNTWEGPIRAEGTRGKSEFVKGFNDETRNYIDNGLWATAIVYTEVYAEKWDFDGTVVALKKTVQKKKDGDHVAYGVDLEAEGLDPDVSAPWDEVIRVLKGTRRKVFGA